MKKSRQMMKKRIEETSRQISSLTHNQRCRGADERWRWFIPAGTNEFHYSAIMQWMSLSEITAKFTYAVFFSLHNVKSTLQRFVFLFPVSFVILIQTSSISDSSMFLELSKDRSIQRRFHITRVSGIICLTWSSLWCRRCRTGMTEHNNDFSGYLSYWMNNWVFVLSLLPQTSLILLVSCLM